ncbi:DUF6234 family protein [Nocardioides sp. NPDC057577]|uniref:DUF6234 family protein n=1 Tax=Nocardioides sp. NPDC057577 TaxID=3346171 RepID=UPI003670515B
MPHPHVRPSTIPVVGIVPLAAVAWLVGFLPGLSPGAMPFDHNDMGGLAAMAIAAGTVGGATAWIRRDVPAAALAAATGGVVAASLPSIYLLGKVAVEHELVILALQLFTVLVVTVSLALGLTAGLGPVWLRSVALAPLAGAAYNWLSQTPLATMPPAGWWQWLLVPILTGILVASVGPGRRGLIGVLTWPVAIGLVWLVQSAVVGMVAIGAMLRPGTVIAAHPDLVLTGFLTYTSEVFTTPAAHQPKLLALSVVVALVIVGVRGARAGERNDPQASPATTATQTPENSIELQKPSTSIAVEILLTCASVALIMAAAFNVFQAYFCLADGLCRPAPAENVVAYRALVGLMLICTIAAVTLALRRRSVSGVIWHFIVAAVAAVSAVVFAVPTIDWDRPPPDAYAPDPSHPGAPACYSGGDSDECPGG